MKLNFTSFLSQRRLTPFLVSPSPCGAVLLLYVIASILHIPRLKAPQHRVELELELDIDALLPWNFKH